MTTFSYEFGHHARISLGLVALQSDETIEHDARRLLTQPAELLVSRIASDSEVTTETLSAMESHLTAAASLFPKGVKLDAVGYGCTSGTSVIGADKIRDLIMSGADTQIVTEPVSALIAACKELGLSNLIFLSPYIEEVSVHLRQVLREAGIETPVFGSFSEASEAAVSRISDRSIIAAVHALATSSTKADAVFLSCTNLRTLDVIPTLEKTLKIPVLSSNLVLLWHLHKSAGVKIPPQKLESALLRA